MDHGESRRAGDRISEKAGVGRGGEAGRVRKRGQGNNAPVHGGWGHYGGGKATEWMRFKKVGGWGAPSGRGARRKGSARARETWDQGKGQSEMWSTISEEGGGRGGVESTMDL
eukprot:scaffold16013_cov27-Tisochrysis_lutea.AAC.4